MAWNYNHNSKKWHITECVLKGRCNTQLPGPCFLVKGNSVHTHSEPCSVLLYLLTLR